MTDDQHTIEFTSGGAFHNADIKIDGERPKHVTAVTIEQPTNGLTRVTVIYEYVAVDAKVERMKLVYEGVDSK